VEFHTKDQIVLGAKQEVCNGKRTFFWLDWWAGSSPLQARFPSLFSCCDQLFVMVHAARVADGILGEWRLRVRQTFGLAEAEDWDKLSREIEVLLITMSK
jgi:hypothetical protein